MTLSQYIATHRDACASYDRFDTRIAFVASIDAFVNACVHANEQHERNAYFTYDTIDEMMNADAIYLIETMCTFASFVRELDSSCVDDIVRAMFKHMSVQYYG